MLRRRNALVPLPLLPPVPSNTIVTSVKIVHNSDLQAPLSPPGDETDPAQILTVMTPEESTVPPTSPTATNAFFSSSLASNKRNRMPRRRSCTPTCPASPTAPTSAVAPLSPSQAPSCIDNGVVVGNFVPSRRPRSTVVVTVRLANPSLPPPAGPIPPVPSQLSTRNSRSISLRKSRFMNISVDEPLRTPLPSVTMAKPQWNKPRVSSNLATCVVLNADSIMEKKETLFKKLSTGILKPTSPVKAMNKKKASKTGSRLAMLRWAVLNASGPEVGKRILGMGVRLAKEIWEAEHELEMEEDITTLTQKESTKMSGKIVDEKMDVDSIVEQSKVTQQVDQGEKEDEEMIDVMESTTTTTTSTTTVATSATTEAMEVDSASPAIVFAPIPATFSRSQRRLSFPKRSDVLATKTMNGGAVGCHRRQRTPFAFSDDKVPVVIVAKKWFEKSAL